jgi:pyridoxal phosphate enzyme (YggS family)
MAIADNLLTINRRIAAACLRAGRDPAAVRLVAVSKTMPAAAVAAATEAGQRLFGESYVQEFVAKAEQVRGPVEWHFIGSLQSNKVKSLAGKVALIHSVDRYSLAAEIDRQWGRLGRNADILLQVNLGGEATKSGTAESGLIDLARRVQELPRLQVRGLMTLPPWEENPEAVRPHFRRLAELSRTLREHDLLAPEGCELSMGMSHDFEVAIEEGATLVRVGTAIFGARQP